MGEGAGILPDIMWSRARTTHIYIKSLKITCKEGASYADPCLIACDFTWDKQRENERIRLVRGKDRGREAWHYVFLHDDEETEQLFEDKIRSGNVDVADYGCAGIDTEGGGGGGKGGNPPPPPLAEVSPP